MTISWKYCHDSDSQDTVLYTVNKIGLHFPFNELLQSIAVGMVLQPLTKVYAMETFFTASSFVRLHTVYCRVSPFKKVGYSG